MWKEILLILSAYWPFLIFFTKNPRKSVDFRFFNLKLKGKSTFDSLFSLPNSTKTAPKFIQ